MKAKARHILVSKAQKAKKPTVISCKTIIGYGSPNKSSTASAHGSPLGKKEIDLVRKKLKWKNNPFIIPKKILEDWRNIGKHGENKFCLLYTSPSPRDGLLSRMPSSA